MSINNTYKIFKNLFYLGFFVVCSCTDYGCIEADDYGEYDSKTYQVYANYAEHLCKRNEKYKSNYTSTEHPIGFKNCFSSECASFSSEDQKYQCANNCEAKCNTLPEKFKQYTATSSATTTLPSEYSSWNEPPYQIVGGSDDIILEEKSAILINATGNISLSGADKGDILVLQKTSAADNTNTQKAEISKSRTSPPINYLKLYRNQNYKINFSGTIDSKPTSSSSTTYLSTNTSQRPFQTETDSIIAANKLNYIDQDYIDGSKRILAFYTKLPPSALNYPENFPIYPEPNTWQCSGENNNDPHSLKCSREESDQLYDDYFTIQNTKNPGQVISTTDKDNYNKNFSKEFPISNLKKETAIFKGNGFIRYTGDNLYGTDTTDDDIPSNLKRTQALDTSSNNQIKKIDFPNNDSDYEIKLKLIGSNCSNTKFVIFRKINDTTYRRIKETPAQNTETSDIYESFDPEILLPNTLSWHTNTIKSFFIQKDWINNLYFKTFNANANCQDINISFFKYHNIVASRSGYVSFGQIGKTINQNNFQTTIVESATTPCSLRFRIINQDNSYETDATDDTKIKPSFSEKYVASPPNQYFIRKGQTISISPESWNGSWTASLYTSPPNSIAITKKCGTEAYIKTIPFPAVFCSKYSVSDYVDINSDADASNNCINPYLDPNTGKFIGCKEDYSVCSSLKIGTTPNNKFCPTECLPPTKSFDDNCRPTFNALTETSAPATTCNTTKITINENCIANDATESGSQKKINSYSQEEKYKNMMTTAGIPPADIDKYFNMTNCNKCINQLITDALKDIYNTASPTRINSLQCYDLEEYTSNLQSIKTALRSSSNDAKKIAINNLKTTKKLKNLKSFNGEYGNLYPMTHLKDSKDSENYPIISTKNSFYSPEDGYLSFFILGQRESDDDISFDTAYLFGNTTKVKIFLESKGEKSNGENLHINLCYANQTSDCESYSTPDNRYGNFDSSLILKVIDFDKTTKNISNESNFSFNPNGYMYRVTSMRPDTDPQYNYECGSRADPTNSFIPSPLSNILCFNTNHNINDRSNGKKYRLMLKIIDPETANCNATSPGSICSPKPPCTSSNCCNGWTILNPKYSGSGTNFCLPTTIDCTEKFYCSLSPYSNNSGKYEVTVRTKRSSKISVSKFINSIISPILQEIEGNENLPDNTFTQNTAIESKIMSLNSFFYNNSFDEDATITAIQDLNYATLDPSIKNPADAKTFVSPNVNNNFNVSIDTTSSHHPDCNSGNCIISYIKFVSYGCQKEANKASLNSRLIRAIDGEWLKKAVEEYCLYRKSCSMRFILDKTNSAAFVLKADGIPNDSSIRDKDSLCTASEPEKLIIKYYYSQSTSKINKPNQVKRIYNEILNTPVYKSILTLSVTLMFSFYGMGFLMGVSELKQSEILDRLIKVGLIYLFTHPQFGWVWFDKFFVTFFKGGIDFLTFLMASLFEDDIGSVTNALNTGNFSDKSPLFWSVDRVVSLLLVNDVIHKKIGSLIFYNFYGILYLIIIYHSIIAYVYTISNAVLLYLTAQFFTSILFILGPLFLIFILFKQTKTFFDNWINSLIGFGLQQIFLIFTLTLFNILLYIIIKMTFGYKVCWDKVWKIVTGVGSISIFSFWTPSDSPPYVSEISTPTTKGEVKDTIPTLPKLLSLWTVCVIMKSFISTITDLAALLSGGMSASELGSGVAGAMNNMVNQVSNKMNKAYVKSGAQKLTQMADKKLFNSGALAKQERKEKRLKMESDQNIKAKMEKDGNKAVSDYKVKNADNFSKMNDDQKRAVLTQVKEDAMKKAAKDAGKSPKEIKELMNDKGVKLTSDTALGALKEFSKQAVFGGGTINSSLAERSKHVDINMSDKEMQKAINKMDPDKRKDFIDGMKSGDNKINKTEGIVQKIQNGELKEAAKNTPMGKAYANIQERKAAIKELEGEGAIKKQSFDTSNSPKSLSEAVRNPIAAVKKGAEMIRGAIERRSDADEKKIQDRMEKNRNSKDDQSPKKEFSSESIAAFEKKSADNDKKNK